MTQTVNLAKIACKIELARINVSIRELEKVPVSKRKALSAEFENLIKEYQKSWTLRNRPGGLQASVKKLEKGLMELQRKTVTLKKNSH